MPRDLISYVVQNLVLDLEPLDVRSVTDDRGGVRVEIRCAQDDAGRVIGRGGRVINSLRTLARAASDGRQRVDVVLIE
jgi:predicted RNA-binding protein YlqC (UPF0109 family)